MSKVVVKRVTLLVFLAALCNLVGQTYGRYQDMLDAQRIYDEFGISICTFGPSPDFVARLYIGFFLLVVLVGSRLRGLKSTLVSGAGLFCAAFVYFLWWQEVFRIGHLDALDEITHLAYLYRGNVLDLAIAAGVFLLAVLNVIIAGQMTKRFALRIAIAVMTFLLGTAAFSVAQKIRGFLIVPTHATELSMRVVQKATVVHRYDAVPVEVYITNNSNETVTLVHPGDGSGSAWGTPITQWSIVKTGEQTSHLTVPNFEPQMRICGNVNALDWDEVFTLGPGETTKLRGSGPWFGKPGEYSIKFLYANRPSTQWLGYELGTHNPFAMWRVKHSTEVTLSSNEINVTVIE